MSRRENPSDSTFLWLALFGLGGYYLYKSGWLSKILAGPSAAATPSEAAFPPARQAPVIITRPNTVAAPPPPGIIQQPAAVPPAAAAVPPPTSFTPGGPLQPTRLLPATLPPSSQVGPLPITADLWLTDPFAAQAALPVTYGPGGLSWNLMGPSVEKDYGTNILIPTSLSPPSGPEGSKIPYQAYPGAPLSVTAGVPFLNPRPHSLAEPNADPNSHIGPAALGKTYIDIDGSIKTFHGEKLLPPPEISDLSQSWFNGALKYVADMWTPLTSGGVYPGWAAYDLSSGKLIGSFVSTADDAFQSAVANGLVADSITPGGSGIIVVYHLKYGYVNVGPWMSVFIPE